MESSKIIIATRLMWPGGVFRTALEEARHMNAKLLVLRKAKHPTPYNMDNVDITLLKGVDSDDSILTRIFKFITLFYDKERGEDATVDMDLIFRLRKMDDLKKSIVLYGDQFIALAGYINFVTHGVDYDIFLHETVLGRKPDLKTIPLLFYDRLILTHARNVITNSDWNKKVLEKYGIKSSVVYLGCDPVEKLNLKRKPIVIAVSMWDKFRKPELYAELAKKIKAQMWICGSWTSDEYMVEFIKKHKDIVNITGPVSEDYLNTLYNEASFYVRFGFEERGPGLGGIEALGHGLPVVTNRGLGISDIVDDFVNGFVVDNISEAAEKINLVISDEKKHSAMITNAWEKGKKLSWKSHANAVLNILKP